MEQTFPARKQILDLIRRRVGDLKEGYRQNICMVGCLYVGKTTILQDFLKSFDDSRIVPVFLDLENRDLSFFVIKTCRSILYHFCRVRGLSLDDDLDPLLSTARAQAPQTVERAGAAMAALERGRPDEAFDLVLTLPDVLAAESGMLTVLIYDEFQALDGMGVSDVFKRLADRITTQKHALYILLSSYQEKARRILEEDLTLLFGSFEMVHVSPLDPRASMEFVEQRLGDLKISLPLRSFLADFTGGRPLYLDILAQELINLGALYKQQEAYAPLLAQAVENLLFNRWGALSRHFELTIERLCAGKNNRLIMSLLFALAGGTNRLRDLAGRCSARPALVSQRLNGLIAECVVEKSGSYFHIKDKLMGYWIRHVFQKRLRSIELDPDQQKRQFKDAFLKDICDFQAVSRMDLSSRVVELLGCFENEQLKLFGRVYRLPVFKDVKTFKMSQRGGITFDVIQAEAGDGLWLLVLRRDPLAEADISLVMDEAKKIGARLRKCVLVSLSGIDDSARLCALNERMWIWNGPVLNSLMSLYGKPYIAA